VPGRRLVPLRWFMFAVAVIGIIPGLLSSAVGAAADIANVCADEARRLQAVANRGADNLDGEIAGLNVLLANLAAGHDAAPGGDPDGRQARIGGIARLLGLPMALHPVGGAPADAAFGLVGGVADAASRPGLGSEGAVVFLPVLRDGAVVGVLDGLLTAARIREAIDGRFVLHQISIAVFDSRGVPVARVGPPGQPGVQVGPLMQVAAVHQSGLLEATAADGSPVVAVIARPARAPGWLVVASEPREVYRNQWVGPLGGRIALSAAAVLIAAAAAWRLGGHLSRSFARLGERAEAVAAGGEAAFTVPASPVLEFEVLRASQLRAELTLRLRAGAEQAALQEARTSSELLSSVVDATADPIHVTGLDGRFILANRAALAVYGAGNEAGRVLGKRATDLLGPDLGGWLESAAQEVLRAGVPVTREVTWRLPDGERRVYAVGKSPWRSADGEITGIVAVTRDITAERAAEARLRAAQAELLRAHHLSAMGVMASGLAHELNQPLAAAANFLAVAGRQLLRAGFGFGLAAAGGSVRDASQQVQRAGEIVRRLRDFVSRGEVELEEVELGELLSGTGELARAGGILADASLSIRPPAAPLRLLADRVQVQQVLLNLIRNAAEALSAQPRPPGDAGGIVLAASRAEAGPAGGGPAGGGPAGGGPAGGGPAGGGAEGSVRITVADNGPGLLPEVQGRLFTPFVSTKRDGMGIGLAICHRIVEGHGGRLTVETGPQGTIFAILLPLTRRKEKPYDQPAS
jgi:two-component system sensor kinase FixL